MNVPPLCDIENNSIDFVVTFQVLEHIKNDKKFIQEIYRVLKSGGKLILTTPNRLMSLSRNPWHVREYTPTTMKEILNTCFTNIKINGVFGNEKIMQYYNENKKSVNRIRRWDVFSLEKIMPRWLLQIPYDILNRFNRKKLQNSNESLVDDINYTDYSISEMNDYCLDYFCVATK